MLLQMLRTADYITHQCTPIPFNYIPSACLTVIPNAIPPTRHTNKYTSDFALLAEISSAIQVHLERHGKAIRRISATPSYERSKKRTTERKIGICVKFSNYFVFIYLSAVILLYLHVSIQLAAIQPKGQKCVCHLCIAYNLVTRGMSRSTTNMHTPLNAYVCVCVIKDTAFSQSYNGFGRCT